MKAKLEVEADSVEEAQKGMKQNMTLFQYRNLLCKNCKNKELYLLLSNLFPSNCEALDWLCDMMTFGALAPMLSGQEDRWCSGAGHRCHSGETCVETRRRKEDPDLFIVHWPLFTLQPK